MKMPFEEDTFDAIYAIEATCHAPDAVPFLFKFSLLSISSSFYFLKFGSALFSKGGMLQGGLPSLKTWSTLCSL